MTLVTKIINILYSGLSAAATNFGSGLNSIVSNLFVTGTGENQDLSVFGTLVVVFGGVALAIGLTRWVLNFISSLGQRNR